MPELDLAAVLDEAINSTADRIINLRPGDDLTDVGEACEGLAALIRLYLSQQAAAKAVALEKLGAL